MENKAAETIRDGFGNTWTTCGPGCQLEIVRPGKTQCNRPDCQQEGVTESWEGDQQ